jgi:hypothetical protein
MNKLYILRPIEGDPLWESWYDKSFGFVVSAASPKEARKLAQESSGDETRNYDGDKHPAWTSPEHSTCKELTATDKSEIIMQDFHSA